MTERREQATPVLDAGVADRMRRTGDPPAPPRDTWERDLPHPAHLLGRECTGEELEAYVRAAAPAGWALVEGSLRAVHRPGKPGRQPWRGLHASYSREAPEGPPWTVDELRRQHHAARGDWQDVADALRAPYRVLRRWLDHPAYAELEPLWREERARLREVEAGIPVEERRGGVPPKRHRG